MLFHTQLDTAKASKGGSLDRRIFRMVTLAFIALTAYLLVSDYQTTINQVERLTLNRLQGIVRGLATKIDGDLHQELTSRLHHKDQIIASNDDRDYLSIHRLLSDSYEANRLNSPIYTFVLGEDQSAPLEFIATSSPQPYFRHQYSTMPKEGYEMLNIGGTLRCYEDEFGSWISAFAPIKNKDGVIVAYVQADEKFDHFIEEVKSKTIHNTLFSLIGLAIIIMGLRYYLKQVVAREEEQRALLEKALDESQLLSMQLEASKIQLQENASKLKQSNKDLTDFAHIASHDLKAPVRTINSFAQLLQRKLGKDIDENTKEYLGFIMSNAQRAQKLIEGLLQYSTADKNMGEQITFPACNAVKEAKQSLLSTLNDRNARINFDEMPLINANPTMISQVMQNLINNGIKYNESANPTIEIGTANDRQKGQYFYVKDNGIGIPQEYQKDIFNMFTRLHTNEQYEGSGIGLAFCVRVIKSYGGEMWLESDEGQGSTFFFNLPNATSLTKEKQTVTA